MKVKETLITIQQNIEAQLLTLKLYIVLCIVKIAISPILTAVFFETGAMPVPTKLRNPTICGSGDPFH